MKRISKATAKGPTKGVRLRKILLWMIMAFCLASVFVAQVWKQNTYMRLAKSISKNEKIQTRLRGEIARLEMQINELKRGDRIEAIAKMRFGLENGAAPVWVYAENTEVQKPVEKLATWSGIRNVFTGGEDAGNREWPTKGL